MKNLHKLHLLTVLGAVALLGNACSEDTGNDQESSQCDGEKCDTPVGDDETCLKRQSEVLDSSNRGYTPTDIRWACADVEGVNAVGGDDRGQEYCEYFAIFQPPAAEEGGERPEAVDLGRNLGSGTTDHEVCLELDARDNCRVTLTEDQQFALEDSPDEVVGACVFTSWHADVPGPLPACADGSCGDEAQIFGFPFTEEFFRMKVGFNSNRAAADLIAECFALDFLHEQNPNQGYIRDVDWDDASDNGQNPFFRGCVGANALFGTGWRRSDPSICAVANRLRECGCTAEGLGDLITQYQQENPRVRLREYDGPFTDMPPSGQAAIVLGDMVIPPQGSDPTQVTKRGFELATWDDRDGLPPGCRYADTGEDTQSIVLCDITASDLMANRQDPKEFCRATYGNNVVVHVPLPNEAISCTPPDTPEAATCGGTPWNIGQEGEEGEAAEQPPAESGDEACTDGADNDQDGLADCEDDGCAEAAACADDSGGTEPTGFGNCEEDRAAAGEKGCENECVQACVCDQDSFCCDSGWDNVCVGEVESFNCADQCAAQ